MLARQVELLASGSTSRALFVTSGLNICKVTDIPLLENKHASCDAAQPNMPCTAAQKTRPPCCQLSVSQRQTTRPRPKLLQQRGKRPPQLLPTFLCPTPPPAPCADCGIAAASTPAAAAAVRLADAAKGKSPTENADEARTSTTWRGHLHPPFLPSLPLHHAQAPCVSHHHAFCSLAFIRASSVSADSSSSSGSFWPRTSASIDSSCCWRWSSSYA